MGATAFGARMAAMTSSRQRSYAYSNAGNLTSFEGNAYAYNDAAHKHALTHISGVQKYWYDANGNATKRITDATYDLTYDAENRLTQLQKNGAVSGTYVYDGDGNRVKETTGSVNTVYISAYFEWTGSVATMKSYYYAGGVRVAMRTGTSAGTVNYLLGDHLGSQALTLTSAGARLSPNKELRYYPYGVARYDTNNQITSFNFTGQRKDSGSGLLFYNARWYDPVVGRFLQADTIVPQSGNPQALNRYSYTLNNPLKYTDPTGHFWWIAAGAAVGAAVAYGAQVVGNLHQGMDLGAALTTNIDGTAIVAGALIGATTVAMAPVAVASHQARFSGRVNLLGPDLLKTVSLDSRQYCKEEWIT